ncbi:hypothetical protein BUALT_Bualt16G0028300 [Buddleja alternifolia]|uniref:Uncharacterized protein n=1 Tax=Buddleja alternifolia TaxID=168488 RepID=A0AAV6WAC1_9LAMI|nr:hypothetical protein BUALT_Bualt16G0028300 [Buddleja alternifolia]
MATVHHRPFFTPHPKPRRVKLTTSTIRCSKPNNPDAFKEKKQVQKDWSVSEVVERAIKLNHWEDVEGLLTGGLAVSPARTFQCLLGHVAYFSRCKSGVASPMLKHTMLSSMHMGELVNGDGERISWKTCFVQLCVFPFFLPNQSLSF